MDLRFRHALLLGESVRDHHDTRFRLCNCVLPFSTIVEKYTCGSEHHIAQASARGDGFSSNARPRADAWGYVGAMKNGVVFMKLVFEN